MTTTVAYVINRVATILQDASHIRWTVATLLDCLNETQKEAVLYKPNASVKNISVPLVAGTKQTIPTDGVSLIKVIRNMGSNGATAGKAIRIVDKDQMDAAVPNWYATPTDFEVSHYTFDMLDPKTFYVYPPSAGQVEIAYVFQPVDCVINGNVSLDDIYVPALIKGTVSAAYAQDMEFASNAELATAYYNAFTSLLGGKSQAEAAVDPNKRAPSSRTL